MDPKSAGLAPDTITQTKEQRDARMAWWRAARFGMFIHWGLYAIPAGVWRGGDTKATGEWIMRDMNIPVADYRALAAQFNPVKFDADAWMALAKAAGAKYVVITAKHHDGFALFPSQADRFNLRDVTPFTRDPLQELGAACAKHGLKLGFYYSQDQDWTAPGGATWVDGRWDKAQEGDFATYLEKKVIPQLEELLNNYRPWPAVIWFDTPTAEMTPELASRIAALMNRHPEVIWNNRLGGGYQGDTETPEQEIPANGFPGRDWEACMTMNDTWGFKSKDTNYKSVGVLLRNLIDIASSGGNYLLNVGPTPEGLIVPQEQERLLAMGGWLKVNGEAIYGTSATPFSGKPAWGRVTQRPGKLYLSIFDWPREGTLHLAISNRVTKAFLLARPDAALAMTMEPGGITVALGGDAPEEIASVVVLEIEGEATPLA